MVSTAGTTICHVSGPLRLLLEPFGQWWQCRTNGSDREWEGLLTRCIAVPAILTMLPPLPSYATGLNSLQVVPGILDSACGSFLSSVALEGRISAMACEGSSSAMQMLDLASTPVMKDRTAGYLAVFPWKDGAKARPQQQENRTVNKCTKRSPSAARPVVTQTIRCFSGSQF